MKLTVIHQTDLFRPHQDPDDHWDLACVYALAAKRHFDVAGILIDHPPASDKAPDITAVSQLNHIYGLRVPAITGSSVPLASRNDSGNANSEIENRGRDFVISTLGNAPGKVSINIVGSCRDVALALNADPELFREKCAAIYLNAGYGTRNTDNIEELEYNVRLNAAAYAAIFEAPCPLYWCPCFEDDARHVVKEWGTNWGFTHADVLNYLSPMLQRFFISMYEREEVAPWLRYLLSQDVNAIIDRRKDEYRNMWSTAGILHMAGLVVNKAGALKQLNEEQNDPVYCFEPIDVSCSDEGMTRWSPNPAAENRYIFHVLALDAYQNAMTIALKNILI